MYKIIANLNKSHTGKKIATNTLYQLIGKVTSMTITVLATIIVTRLYGREGYGEFNIMQNFPALFFIIVDFGLNAIATREISQHKELAEKYLSNIFVLRLVMSGMLMALCVMILRFFPYSESLKIGIYFSLLLILTQSLYASANIIFQVRLRYDLSTISYIAGSVVVLVLVLVFSYAHFSIAAVSFAYVIGGLVTFLLNLRFIKKLGYKIFISFDGMLWKTLLLQTLPLGLMFVFSQINFKADSILISVLKLPDAYKLNNTESVAVYGLAYKIFEVALVVPTFFMNAAYPVLVSHMVEGKERLQNTFSKSVKVLLLLGLSAGVFGVTFSPLMIRILGGSQFSQSVFSLQLLFLGIVVFYLTQPLSWLIVTLGKQKYLPAIYLISAVFNVSANIIFIPKYSFYASSVITWTSEALILLMLCFAALKAWKLKYA
jgi:O-antigen/teichoic acid export membrane protein